MMFMDLNSKGASHTGLHGSPGPGASTGETPIMDTGGGSWNLSGPLGT